MAAYKTITDLELAGQRVLVRLDLNVPIKNGTITDYTRIDASIPTIEHIIERGGRAVLMSHLGRPGGERDDELSLAPVADALSERLGQAVPLAPDCVGEETAEYVDVLGDGAVLLLENLRFHAGEEACEDAFVTALAELGDVYINDAFGTAHRAHASTYGLPKLFVRAGKPVAAGFLMDKELSTWRPIVEGSGSSVAIVGGAKLAEKMKAVAKFAKRFDTVVIGGVVANVFLKAAGFEIGASKYMEKGTDYTATAAELLDTHPDTLTLPSTVIATDEALEKRASVDPRSGLRPDQMAVDVIYEDIVYDRIANAQRLVWFGPLGMYEEGFDDGTKRIVAAIGRNANGTAVLGGGDLAAATHGVNAAISTGGGASIEYITTGKLDALSVLEAGEG